MPEAASLRGPRGSPHRWIEWSVAFAKREAQVRPPSPTDTRLSATSVHGPQRRTIPVGVKPNTTVSCISSPPPRIVSGRAGVRRRPPV